jgi:O-antigen ligase
MPFADGWATNAVLVLERPYAGIFSIICIILSFDQILLRTKGKQLFIASLLLSIFFVFFISIRISIVTLFILFLLYGLFYLKVYWKKKAIFSMVIFFIFITVFLLNKNIAKRFFIDDNLNQTFKTTVKFEPRVIIWSCASDISKQENFSVLFGTDSYSNIKQSLTKCYSEKLSDYSRRNWFVETSFNTHSQFIDLYLIGGIFAILLFALFLINSLLISYKDFCSVAIIISFLMFFLIENVFHRQFGCFIFTIFTSLYLNRKKTNGIIQS